jgi:hypothetical protein
LIRPSSSTPAYTKKSYFFLNLYVDALGAEQVVDQLNCLRDRLGLRFEPAPALVEAGRDNRKFSD